MLFGHQSDNNRQDADQPNNSFRSSSAVNPLAIDPATGVSLPTTDDDVARPIAAPINRATSASTPAPASAVSSNDPLGGLDDDILGSVAKEDLLALKQNALAQLGPLVDHLDQTPEEKFRTTMMMIQSADNQSLIPIAYKAAQSITDEKARAQALLDIVNEINYFTQKAS